MDGRKEGGKEGRLSVCLYVCMSVCTKTHIEKEGRAWGNFCTQTDRHYLEMDGKR